MTTLYIQCPRLQNGLYYHNTFYSSESKKCWFHSKTFLPWTTAKWLCQDWGESLVHTGERLGHDRSEWFVHTGHTETLILQRLSKILGPVHYKTTIWICHVWFLTALFPFEKIASFIFITSVLFFTTGEEKSSKVGPGWLNCSSLWAPPTLTHWWCPSHCFQWAALNRYFKWMIWIWGSIFWHRREIGELGYGNLSIIW